MGKPNTPTATTEEAKGEFAPLPEITEATANEIKTAEPLYSSAELAASARKLFDTTPEVVESALFDAKKIKATKTEAAVIIKKFLGKEVK